jgi:hypothetical protein
MDVERIETLLRAGPPAEPRYVPVLAAHRDPLAYAARTEPVRGWHAEPRRRHRSPARAFVAIAAIVVVAVVGYNLLPGTSSGPGGPSPTPAATASPTASPPAPTPSAYACRDFSVTCAGPLDPGPHGSGAFRPAVTYDVPAGWTNSFDGQLSYVLEPQGGSFDLKLLSYVAIPEQTADCGASGKAGAESSLANWTSFLTTHPGLEASTPAERKIKGRDAVTITVRVSPAWQQTCPGLSGPAVLLVMDNDTPPTRSQFIGDEYVTLTIVNAPSELGEFVIVEVLSAGSASDHEAAVSAAERVIESMTFSR